MFFGAGQGPRKRLFKLFGFPIYAELSLVFLLFIILIGAAGGGPQGTIAALIFALVAVFSIVIHELGHALAIRKLGHGESTIVLHGLGGVCQWRGQASRRDRILIALAGPAVNLVVGGIVAVIVLLLGLPGELLSRSLLWALLITNLGWAVFNLMPIWPLDGGHVLRYALVGGRRSRAETLQLSLTVSMVTAGILAVIGIMYGFLFLAILLGFILYSNYRELQQAKGPPTSYYGY